MENVTDEVSNPFGMRPPCPHDCGSADGRQAVFGYGDANADFHVIGDHPGVHGGSTTGVPFRGHAAGERVLDVLEATGFLRGRGADGPQLANCFLSYLYLCCVPPGEEPTPDEYATFERFFDAELRAIAADVLVPVGERATRHVLAEFTSKADLGEAGAAGLHATQVRGRGFLVVPLREPAEWSDADYEAAVRELRGLLDTDYHQLVDLGRFGASGEPYFVR